MKRDRKPNDLNVKEYPVIENIFYCARCTKSHYPPLLWLCAFAVLLNVALPTLTVYLPKIVIDRLTSGVSAETLTVAVLSLTLSIAVLLGLKKFTERLTYFHKFKMNSYYLRKVAEKGMTTDYCNQENDHFRKLQSESYSSCNGHYSNLTQVYDTGVALLSNALGFMVYFGILARLNIFVVMFLIATTLISYFLNKKIIRWAADNNKEKIGYVQKTNYINDVSGDIKSAKDIRLYSMSAWFDKVYSLNIKGLAGWYRCYTARIFKSSFLTLFCRCCASAQHMPICSILC